MIQALLSTFMYHLGGLLPFLGVIAEKELLFVYESSLVLE